VVPTEDDDANNIQGGVLWKREKGDSKEEKQKDVKGDDVLM
jgi:hypothetical protein